MASAGRTERILSPYKQAAEQWTLEALTAEDRPDLAFIQEVRATPGSSSGTRTATGPSSGTPAAGRFARPS